MTFGKSPCLLSGDHLKGRRHSLLTKRQPEFLKQAGSLLFVDRLFDGVALGVFAVHLQIVFGGIAPRWLEFEWFPTLNMLRGKGFWIVVSGRLVRSFIASLTPPSCCVIRLKLFPIGVAICQIVLKALNSR